MKFKSGLLVSALLAASAQAADEPKVWTTAAELGAITTSGNTSGTSVTGKIDAKQELTSWSNEYVLSAFFKEDEKLDANGDSYNEKSAERYFVSGKGGYKLDNDNAKLFVFGSHTKDEFGSYLDYSLVSVGYGDRLYQNDTMTLDVEIGPGYFRGKTAPSTPDKLEITEKGAMLRTAANFDWKVSENATFRQTVSIDKGADNTRTATETSLSAKINGRMQMKAAFIVQNDSEVPAAKKATDTQTSLTLVYSF
jgi:putative salt-induced outer membrane protein YdiY